MSRREVIDCDRCKTETKEAGTVYFAVGYSSCPAGGRGEDDEVRIDLCPSCLVALVNHLKGKVFKLEYEHGKAVVEWVRSHKRKP